VAATTSADTNKIAITTAIPPTAQLVRKAVPGLVRLIWRCRLRHTAPFADWQPLYNEACEEASMVMATYYFRQQPLTKEK
jgi:hypothetical protein